MKTINLKYSILVIFLLFGYDNGSAQDYTKKIDDNVRAEQIKAMKFGMYFLPNTTMDSVCGTLKPQIKK